MNAYPDTSFLCALYRQQDNSAQALTWRARMAEPLHVTRLLLWEFRQSARLQAFRHSRDRTAGYPLHEADRMIAKLSEHVDADMVKIMHIDAIDLLVTAERISKARTFAGGHRSFDLLHVATAVVLGAKEFLSFDANQNSLAAAEGMAVPLQHAR